MEITALQALEQIFCVQAQDYPAAQLALRARSAGLIASEVEKERQEPQQIIRTWCLRGTLHLVTARDARWLVPLLGPRLIAGGQRRFRDLGWDEDRSAAGLLLLEQNLHKSGRLTRPEVIELLSENHLPAAGQAPVHLLYQAALRCILCMGPDRDGQETYVPFEAWVGEPQRVPREEAIEKLALCYLEAYAPASPEDFAYWAGLPLGEARQAWGRISRMAVPLENGGRKLTILESQREWLDEVQEAGSVVSLLPAYDAYLLGYAGREMAVPEPFARRVHPGGGLIRPVVSIDGLARGTWSKRRYKGGVEVLVEPFEELSEDVLKQVETEVQDLGRFLEKPVTWKIVTGSRQS